MTTKKKSAVTKKVNAKKKSKTLIPEVLDKQPEIKNKQAQPKITSDATSVQEISIMQTAKYSENIIDEVRSKFNLEELKKLKSNRSAYLHEGRKQIDSLWNGIHALNIHTEMFTVLFLIAMGSILKEIKESFAKPHHYAKWRRDNFDIRHKRLFQQAMQLTEMGEFSRKYSALGKTRILQLEYIRKEEGKKSCEDILVESPEYEEIVDSALPDKVVKKMNVEPFPDISYDLDNERVKHYVNSVITYERLKKLGMSYVDFDQAKLISYYNGQAIPVKKAQQIKDLLDKKPAKDRPVLFDNLVMDRMKISFLSSGVHKSSLSLNKLISDFLRFCHETDYKNKDWLIKQKALVDKNMIMEASFHLNTIAVQMGFVTENKK